MSNSQTFKKLLFGLVKQIKADVQKQFSNAKVRITPLQYTILAILLHGKSLTLNELADNLGVRPPSLVPPIDGLVKLGYVHRQPDKADRRKLHLVSSASAKKMFKKIHQNNPEDGLRHAFEKLNKTKQEQLVTLLAELTRNLN